jgi:hypothetical protein
MFIIILLLALGEYHKLNVDMANNQRIFHQYKYLTLKQAKVKEDIKFNKICLSKNITPNYVQLNTKSKSQAAMKTLNTAKKNLDQRGN